MVLGAKLLIGTVIGATLSPDVFRQLMHFFGPGVLAVTTVLAVGVFFGWGFAAWGLMEPGESMFGLLPGGVGEMVATAASLGLDGAAVTGAHMVRLFTVVLSLPLILRAAEAIHRRWIAGGGNGQAG
ncbi:AbrB family transcriptional regulator [Parasphingorhabdus pacifica]